VATVNDFTCTSVARVPRRSERLPLADKAHVMPHRAVGSGHLEDAQIVLTANHGNFPGGR